MYRIEVRPGEETVFRTIEELATGIRNGFITPRARIFHAASQKWLPIEFHPHYKKALEGDFTPAPPAPQPSLAAIPMPVLTPMPSPVPSAIVALRGTVEPAPRAPRPVVAEPLAPASVRHMAAVEPEPEATEPDATEPDAEEPDAEEPEEPGKWEAPAAVIEVPRPVRPAELVLPNITYPEVPLAREPAHRPARRSRQTRGRPMLLMGSAAALLLGANLVIGARNASPGREEADEQAPRREAVGATTPAAPSRPGSAPAPAPVRASALPASASAHSAPADRVPAPGASVLPMTPGPAFAASAPTRAPQMPTPGPERSPERPPASPAAQALAAPAPAAVEPAPGAIELELPALPASDSLAPLPRTSADSLALKRILKAVSDRKPVPPPSQ